MQPKCVRFPFATTDGPFTAIGTNGVFPFWLNLILKAMEVSSNIQLARVMDIVVKAEIPLNLLAMKEYINTWKQKLKTNEKTN